LKITKPTKISPLQPKSAKDLEEQSSSSPHDLPGPSLSFTFKQLPKEQHWNQQGREEDRQAW